MKTSRPSPTFVVERLRALGRRAGVRLLRRRHQRLHGRPAPRRAAIRSSCRPGTRRPPPSWRSGTRSTPARSASSLAPRAPARCTCSTACTTPSSTACRWWRSSASSRRTVLGLGVPAGDRPASAVQGRRRAVRPDGRTPPSRCRWCWTGRSARALATRVAARGDRAARRAEAARARRADARARRDRRRRPGGARRGCCRTRTTCAAAAEVLDAGERVALLVGQGARGAPTRCVRGRRPARRRRRHQPARQAVRGRVAAVRCRRHGPPRHHGERAS